MSNNTKGRIISAVVLILILTVILESQSLKEAQTAREAFLADQGKRYDRNLACEQTARAKSILCALGASVIVFGGFFVVYELTAFGIARVLDRAQSRSQGVQSPIVSS